MGRLGMWRRKVGQCVLRTGFAFVLAGFLAGAVPVSRASVPEYGSYELQARSNITDGFNLPAGSSFNSGTPAISSAAVVTFRLLVVGNTGNGGLWYGSAGLGSVVYDAPVDRFVGDPAVNSAGVVSFERTFDFLSEGVWIYDPESGATSLRVPVGGPFGIDNFADPEINDSGQIGCRVDLGAVQAYIVDDAGTQTQYAAEGSGGVGYLFVARFNDALQLAGKVRLGGTAESLPDEIRRYEPGGGWTTIAVDQDGDPGSVFTRFGNGVDLSDNGWVAFTATVADGEGVFLSDGTTTRTIATVANPEISGIDFFHPAVNDDGLVAFRAFDAAGLRAIFAGDGTTLRRVVTEHDILPTDRGEARVDQNDNSPVFGGNPAINARGDVAFAASLTPPDNNQIEWGSGMFIAYAGDPAGLADEAGSAPSEPRWRTEPNPFRETIQMEWTAPLGSELDVNFTVHDLSGRLLRRLIPNIRRDRAQLDPGIGVNIDTDSDAGPLVRLIWDGRDESGRPVPAGVYYVRSGGIRDAAEGVKIVRTR